MKALAIAFSMYSRLPMPVFPWEEKDRKLAMCFFPAVGIFVGTAFLFAFLLLDKIGANGLFTGAVLTAVPIFTTGGIHMDGFLDTCDARASCGSRERKLEILKDSRTGAFAVLFGCLYLLLACGAYSMLDKQAALLAALGFVLSRALSGAMTVLLPNARERGMLADFTKDGNKKATAAAMAGYFLLAAAAVLLLSPFRGGLLLLCSLGTWLYCRHVSIREFGGITGDLAGYFLSLCELSLTLCLAATAGF